MITLPRYKIQDTGYRIKNNQASGIMHRALCIGSSRASCITNHAGFTLVELLITMVVFVFVIAAASGVFTGLLTQFKQQSKIAETKIEGIVGLEDDYLVTANGLMRLTLTDQAVIHV